jgi:hypothetical protein
MAAVTKKPPLPREPIAREWESYAGERDLDGSTSHRRSFYAGAQAALVLLRRRVTDAELQRELREHGRLIGTAAEHST